jgi:hypothetical protein
MFPKAGITLTVSLRQKWKLFIVDQANDAWFIRAFTFRSRCQEYVPSGGTRRICTTRGGKMQKIPLAVYIGVEEGEEGEGTSSCPWLRSQSDMTMALAFMI